MFFILLSSFGFSKFSVPFLNNKTFENLVERRSRADVWIVFFQGISQPLLKDKGEKAAGEKLAIISNGFSNASKISMGLKFAIVDVSRYPQIPEKFNIKKIPSIHIFYDGGVEEYKGNYKPKSIIKSGIAHQVNFVKNITDKWKTEFIAQPSVMMFSDKEKMPAVWKSLAIYYYGKSIRIGFTNNEDFFFPYEIKKTPTILGTLLFLWYNGRLANQKYFYLLLFNSHLPIGHLQSEFTKPNQRRQNSSDRRWTSISI